MANLNLVDFKQLKTGQILGVVSGYAIESNNATLVGASGVLVTRLTTYSGFVNTNFLTSGWRPNVVTGLVTSGSVGLSGTVAISGISGVKVTVQSLNNTMLISLDNILTGIRVTGSVAATGVLNVTAVSGVNVELSGNSLLISSRSPYDRSFYLATVPTGLNISEVMVPYHIGYTGYAVSCVQSGAGPEVAGVNAPMTGRIYTVSTGNTKYTLTQFTFNSGELFQQSGGANVMITGWNRLGFDITRSLSGISGVTISIMGYKL